MVVASNHRCAAGLEDGAWTTVDSIGQRSKELTCGRRTTTGASASLSLSNTARLYINYDGKFRAAAQSHQGTFGVEFKW
jgi:hypothetical protein